MVAIVLSIAWILSLPIAGLLLLRAILAEGDRWERQDAQSFVLAAAPVVVMILYLVASMGSRGAMKIGGVALFAFLPCGVLAAFAMGSNNLPATRTAKIASLISSLLAGTAFFTAPD